jgi:hypothetical protein
MRIARLLLPFGLMVGCAPSQSQAEPEGPRLSFPVACKIGQTCEIQNYVDRDPGPGAKDYRCGPRTYEAHNGVDIRLQNMVAQRAGVDVLAAAAGKVARLRDGVADISVKAADAPPATGAECGNGLVLDHGNGWETQYCHLAKGSLKVKAGDLVTAGQPIARIGLSGNTEYPHLHITVRHGGAVVDPFAPTAAAGSCDVAATSGQGLWDTAAAKAMGYQSGAVLNAGFASAAVTPDGLEAGTVAAAGSAAPALVAYVRAIDLDKGDEQMLVLKDPAGAVLAQSKLPPLASSKAQYLIYVGKARPAAGWAPGVYSASYTVLRAGKAAVSRSFQIRL